MWSLRYAREAPSAKPIDEDAAHFLVRMVRQYPNQITIYEGGPMTNLALAISIDPEFPSLAKELVSWVEA
jgi:purine nucleosidase